MLAGLAGLAGCAGRTDARPQAAAVDLRKAGFAVGSAVQTSQLDDPAFSALLLGQVSQITPEWEMKMEYVVQPDGSWRFAAPDRIAAFARTHGLRLFCTTLVWYAQSPAAFERLAGRPTAFAAAYEAYIEALVTRYRGLSVGWDVVNEPVAEDGSGLRESIWSRTLGQMEHMKIAFERARACDPEARLFLNDYNLETIPAKRKVFLGLVERLLAAGAPIDGIGVQTHVPADLPAGAIRTAMTDVASLGLPVHVSEMDVSISRSRFSPTERRAALQAQSRVYAEAADVFAGLGSAQRFAFTFWGLRDSDSWLLGEDRNDAPSLFDAEGRPKPAARAWLEAAQRGMRPGL